MRDCVDPEAPLAGLGRTARWPQRTVTRARTKTARKLVSGALLWVCDRVAGWGPLCKPKLRLQMRSASGADLLPRCGAIR